MVNVTIGAEFPAMDDAAIRDFFVLGVMYPIV